MRYNPQYKAEIDNIINIIEQEVCAFEFSKDLTNTPFLCRFLLLTIFSIIKSAYHCIEDRCKVACDILIRSLIEYVIDLKFIALNDDPKYNRRFGNYHKLILYWRKDEIENYRQEIPRIEREYKEYVASEFPDLVKERVVKNEVVDLCGLKPEDKVRKINMEFPGLILADNNAEKIKGWSQIRINKEIINSDIDYWKVVDKKIKGMYQKSWSGLNFHSRVEKIKRMAKDEDPSLERISFMFRYYSNFTHPTAYGTVFGFNPKDMTYSDELKVSDPALKQAEQHLFHNLDASIRDFIRTLEGNTARELHGKYDNTWQRCRNLCDWFRVLLARRT